MLKRLELIGFKSFADKTRFDFPPGITAIVGPNGSGKSNVVDAIRWVLGEQSAKSMRGGEMADVIFNGSASRKSLGMAEVVMTLDNTRRHVILDADEVQIARRVYRDGTGEYLINQQISRLRDVKEMFLGSGAGSHAYSTIEQGRVDALLQTSTHDRRIVFEEAAGISRFKARKVETLRKLEAVDQNLARLRDVATEVEKQLRRVRMEAGKAQRFQEYSVRLRELRIGMGLREFGTLATQLEEGRAILQSLRDELAEVNRETAEWEAEDRSLEESLTQSEAALEEGGRKLSEVREQIASLEAFLAAEGERANEQARQLAEGRRRRVELTSMIRTATAAVGTVGAEVMESEALVGQQRRRVEELEEQLADTEVELGDLQRQIQQDRAAQVDLVRQAGTLQSQAEAKKSELERFNRDREQRRRRVEQRSAEMASMGRLLDDLERSGESLQSRLAEMRASLDQQIRVQQNLRQLVETAQQELEELRVRRGELGGRLEVLEGWERSQEGLGSGVREVMALLAQERQTRAVKTPRLCDAVIGLIADHLSVPRSIAPLIDLALGEAAQKFAVRDAALLDVVLTARSTPFCGRVGFLPIQPQEPLAQGDETSTADRWVTCDLPELAGLPRQLLGNVYIVDDLPTARAYSVEPDMEGFRFVTRQGELLDRDGTLTVGAHATGSGILSRKSELRELLAQAEVLDREVAATEQRLADLRRQSEELQGPIQTLGREISLLTDQAGDLQAKMARYRQGRDQIREELELVEVELRHLSEDIVSLEQLWKSVSRDAEEAEQSAAAMKLRLEEAERAILDREEHRVRQQQEHTAGQVQLAQMEERQTALKAQFEQREAELRRGREEESRLERYEGTHALRWQESQLATLNASARLADAFLEKEVREREAAGWYARRDQERERRRILGEQLHSARSASREKLDLFHRQELAVHDLDNQRGVLSDRLREDYQLDLAAEYETYRQVTPPEQDPLADVAAVNAEIDQLRERIRKLGNVSLESLTELAEVEARSVDLQNQLKDLMSAQGSLMEIIAKINQDSRRLFTETYETVRTHFQNLFRKLFGGGMADVVLENPDDVLESGIEIVARPPGKELRSITLMSGGEKTLTAVALLLAIFRSKPSPFCLLDEVDAALDEANTARLAGVLREFLDLSQFIIVTHKKRTMAMADVLYGITMQESGISKQVAVRLEDWPEDAEPPALAETG